MAVSTRTAVAIHALTYLAHWSSEGWQSSTRIAASLDSNPVFVRRILTLLQAKGLVTAAEGSGGGWQLVKPADEITLADAYRATEGDAPVLPTHAHPPNQHCVIGRHMQGLLEHEFAAAQRALEDQLSGTSIGDLLRQVHPA